jgi:hypothetical protein
VQIIIHPCINIIAYLLPRLVYFMSREFFADALVFLLTEPLLGTFTGSVLSRLSAGALTTSAAPSSVSSLGRQAVLSPKTLSPLSHMGVPGREGTEGTAGTDEVQGRTGTTSSDSSSSRNHAALADTTDSHKDAASGAERSSVEDHEQQTGSTTSSLKPAHSDSGTGAPQRITYDGTRPPPPAQGRQSAPLAWEPQLPLDRSVTVGDHPNAQEAAVITEAAGATGRASMSNADSQLLSQAAAVQAAPAASSADETSPPILLQLPRSPQSSSEWSEAAATRVFAPVAATIHGSIMTPLEQLSLQLFDAIADRVASTLESRLPSAVSTLAVSSVTRRLISLLLPQVTRDVSRHAVEEIVRQLGVRLARAVTAKVVATLTPRLTRSVAAAVYASLIRQPAADYYCVYCREGHTESAESGFQSGVPYCQLCAAQERQDAYRMGILDWYAAQYGQHYGQWSARHGGKRAADLRYPQEIVAAATGAAAAAA